ncbi:MAG: transporter substrate-binding domain-containing protein [Bacteroidetes bacterium]|nr:transporter substrate-binding domain-containing protein [Bacteroidota bacterium]
MISVKKLGSALLLATCILLICTCKKDEEFKLKVLTEDYAPFNYLDNGQLKGSSADLVNRIMSDLGEEGTIEVLQWDAAYSRLLNESDIALFTTDRTPERNDLFKWAGPIARIDHAFFALATSGLIINNLDAAKAVNGIAVVNGYSAQEMLESYGFQNLVICQNLEEALQKLLDNQVDLIIESRHAIQLTLQNMGHDYNELENVYVLQSYLSYIAFNKNVPDDVVEKWQNQINILKDNGTLQQLYQQYIPGDIAPGKLQIFTEENPPQNYACGSDELCGSAIEIVNDIRSRTGCQDPIHLENWTNAYNMTLINPNTVLFSTSRSEARENLFDWIGPICRNISNFYVTTSSGTSINSFEEARALSGIGVISGWYTEQILADSGFTNLQSFSTPLEALIQLMEGHVEAAVLSDISIQYLTESAGYTPDDVSVQIEVATAYLYIAFGKNSKSDYVNAWNNALTQMKQDGAFVTIWNEWYPGLPLP